MSTPDRDSAPERVMVIALDGATWDLAHPWMEAGYMPNLTRLVSDGVSAVMRAELPPSSVPNWPAFMTGKNAGKHGCLWWLGRDATGSLNQVPIDSQSVRGDTIWSYLSSHGKRVIVQNVPVTYPVEPINGVMISGLLTPRSAEDFVYPASLKTNLDTSVGGYQIYPQGGYARGREHAFLNALITNIRQHTKAADFLLRSQVWDFFILVLGPTDEGSHKYWHYLDPDHHLHKPEEATKFGDSIQKLYTAADEAIGALLQHMSENDTLIVMSDHGFGPVEGFFLPNNWLMQQGYLQLKRTAATLFRRTLFRAGFTPRNVFPLGKQILSFLQGSDEIRQRLDPGRQGGKSPIRKVFLSEDDIEWSRTRVMATGFVNSQLFINLRGREPQGIVEISDYEPLRDRLIAELSSVVNPLTGKPHYDRIYRREELYSGPLLDSLPDLLCVPADLRIADSGVDFRSTKLFETDLAVSGTHRSEGIFVMVGPGVLRGTEIPPIRIFDLAPTIIHRLGLPVPNDMDGQVITAALEADELSTRQVQLISPRNFRGGERTFMSDEDEETIKERLSDLGYLG